MLKFFIVTLSGLIPGLGLFLLKRWEWACLVLIAIFALIFRFMSASAKNYSDTLDSSQLIILGLFSVVWISQYIYTVKLASQFFDEEELLEDKE